MLSVANFHLRNCHSEKYAIFAMTVPNFSGAEKIADFINRDLERNVAAATPPATVDIIGLRRCGKTTFLRQQVETLSGEIRWFNCDYASDAEQLRIGSKSDAEALLRLAPNIVIIWIMINFDDQYLCKDARWDQARAPVWDSCPERGQAVQTRA